MVKTMLLQLIYSITKIYSLIKNILETIQNKLINTSLQNNVGIEIFNATKTILQSSYVIKHNHVFLIIL